jgi:hypothetical protein
MSIHRILYRGKAAEVCRGVQHVWRYPILLPYIFTAWCAIKDVINFNDTKNSLLMQHNFRRYTNFTFHSLTYYIIKATNDTRNTRCTLPVKERQLVKNLAYVSSFANFSYTHWIRNYV